MNDYREIQEQLRKRLSDLIKRADGIEKELSHPLEADSSEQSIDLADDEALEGVEQVLRDEIRQVNQALLRIENGTYGHCAVCGAEIGLERLRARPIATRCIKCA